MDRRWFVLALFVSLSLGATQAQESNVLRATFDLFSIVDTADMDSDITCDEHAEAPGSDVGEIIVADSGRAFTFREGDTLPVNLPGVQGVETRAACAMARFNFDVPPMSDHMHVRFTANRTVDHLLNLERHLIQRLIVLADGTSVFEEDVFGPTEGERGDTRFAYLGPSDLTYIPLPPETDHVTVIFYFQDLAVQDGLAGLSAHDFSAKVRQLSVEFSGHPVPIAIERHEDRQVGTNRFEDTLLRVTVPGELWERYLVNIRLQMRPDLEFQYVQLPDGSDYDNTGSPVPLEEYNPWLDRILVEEFDTYMQVSLPWKVIGGKSGGPSEYTFHFTQSETLEPNEALFLVNLALLAVPPIYAVVAYVKVRRFEHHAFGGFQRSARNLRIAVVLMALFYLAVVTAAAFVGWVTLMSVLPPGPEAIILYLQVLVAVVAFIWLWRTAEELDRMTQPGGEQDAIKAATK